MLLTSNKKPVSFSIVVLFVIRTLTNVGVILKECIEKVKKPPGGVALIVFFLVGDVDCCWY